MSNLVSSVDPNSYYTSPAPKAKSDLDMTTFLNLLTVQMANQNPLEPMSDRDFFAQLAQLGQVQGIDNLQKQSDYTNAQNLIGKSITAVDSTSTTGQLISGNVVGVSNNNGTYKLVVEQSNGSQSLVGLDAIQSVSSDGTSNQIPADYSYLIGKQVSGVNGSTTISGQVSSIAISNGTIIADVTTSGGTKLQLPVTGIQSISQ